MSKSRNYDKLKLWQKVEIIKITRNDDSQNYYLNWNWDELKLLHKKIKLTSKLQHTL